MEHAPRVLFLGMQGSFSLPSLQALLAQGIKVCGVVVPTSAGPPRAQPLPIARRTRGRVRRTPLPVLNSSLGATIVDLAWQQGLPVWEVSNMSASEVVNTLSALRPDAICVACFSLRIPRAILSLPPLGCLNVHPSLLPALRGPEPLFWALRLGLRWSGVSVHLMDEGMDTGDVLAAAALEIPAGIRYARLEERCARLGGELLARAVWELSRGEAVRTPQDEQRSSHQSFPAAEDFIVPAALWSAERVYAFVRGIAGWQGEPLSIETAGGRLPLRGAISYSHKDTGRQPGEVVERQGTALSLQCARGWVSVEVG